MSLKKQIEDLGSVKKIVSYRAYQDIPPFRAHGRIEWEIVEKKAGNRFKVLPKQWMVERTLAWLNNFRHLSKDYEKSTLMCSKGFLGQH